MKRIFFFNEGKRKTEEKFFGKRMVLKEDVKEVRMSLVRPVVPPFAMAITYFRDRLVGLYRRLHNYEQEI